MAYKDKSQAVKYNNDFIKNAYDRINLTVPKGYKALLQEAATEQHGGKVNSLLNALITAELERQKLIPSEAAQRPTEAVTASPDETYSPADRNAVRGEQRPDGGGYGRRCQRER